jgi:hypothetical protein
MDGRRSQPAVKSFTLSWPKANSSRDAGAVRVPWRIDPALPGDFDVAAVHRPAFALADVSPSKFISAAAQLFEACADDVAFLAPVDPDVIEKRAQALEILRLPKIVLGNWNRSEDEERDSAQHPFTAQEIRRMCRNLQILCRWD